GVRIGLGLVTSGIVAVIVLVAILVSLDEIGRPLQYDIVAGYRGWVALRYEDRSCPRLGTRGMRVAIVIDQSGRGCYADPAPQGWRQVKYEYVMTDGTRVPIAVTGWGGGGGIWGGTYGAWSKTVKFFVGSEEEYRANASTEPR